MLSSSVQCIFKHLPSWNMVGLLYLPLHQIITTYSYLLGIFKIYYQFYALISATNGTIFTTEDKISTTWQEALQWSLSFLLKNYQIMRGLGDKDDRVCCATIHFFTNSLIQPISYYLLNKYVLVWLFTLFLLVSESVLNSQIVSIIIMVKIKAGDLESSNYCPSHRALRMKFGFLPIKCPSHRVAMWIFRDYTTSVNIFGKCFMQFYFKCFW